MKTLISAQDLLAAMRGPRAPVLFDCSFDLTDPEAGART